VPTITLNGKAHDTQTPMGLVQLLASLEIDRRLVAVAHNGEVIPRDRYEEVSLTEGDSLEIVRMVGGG